MERNKPRIRLMLLEKMLIDEKGDLLTDEGQKEKKNQFRWIVVALDLRALNFNGILLIL